MRGAAHFADFGHAGAHQHALVGDEHDLVICANQRGGYDLAVALALLNGDHALGATAVAGVFRNMGALAVAVFGCRKHAGAASRVAAWLGAVGFGHQQGDDALAFFQLHAAHAAGVAAHGAHVVFVKAHGFAAVAKQHDVVRAVG